MNTFILTAIISFTISIVLNSQKQVHKISYKQNIKVDTECEVDPAIRAEAYRIFYEVLMERKQDRENK